MTWHGPSSAWHGLSLLPRCRPKSCTEVRYRPPCSPPEPTGGATHAYTARWPLMCSNARPIGTLTTFAWLSSVPRPDRMFYPVETPVLTERDIHSLRSFLDGINPRKHPTTFFLEYVVVGDIVA